MLLAANVMVWLEATAPRIVNVAPASMISVPVPERALVTVSRCSPSV